MKSLKRKTNFIPTLFCRGSVAFCFSCITKRKKTDVASGPADEVFLSKRMIGKNLEQTDLQVVYGTTRRSRTVELPGNLFEKFSQWCGTLFEKALARTGKEKIYLTVSSLLGPSGTTGKVYKLVLAEWCLLHETGLVLGPFFWSRMGSGTFCCGLL